MVTIGIDPGADGAGVVLGDRGILGVLDFAKTTPMARAEWLAANRFLGVDLVAVEQVGAMPGQGVRSMFSFGLSAGWVHGVLDALGLPWRLVRPQAWQKGVVPPKGGKGAAVVVAERLWPGTVFRGPRGGLLTGRADAALIALWARGVL